MAAEEEKMGSKPGDDAQRTTGATVKPDNPYNQWAAAVLRAARKSSATNNNQADFSARLAARLGVAPFTRQTLSHWESCQVLVPAAVLLAALEEAGVGPVADLDAFIDSLQLMRALDVRRRAAGKSVRERMVEVERSLPLGEHTRKEDPPRNDRHSRHAKG